MTSDTARIKATVAQERHFHPVVAVVGVGYVGSHLVEAFAGVYEVIAFDVSKQRIEKIAQQFSGSAAVRTTSHAPDLAAADAILISVPTPLNHDKTIDTTFLEIAIRTIAQHVRPGVTVVVESTVAIGMTRELLSFLVATKHAKVGMSPERVDPGRKFPAFQSIPKIISGIDSPSLTAVHQLYGRVFDHLIPVSSLEAAEMTKLYENCQRMVCAAYANEMADACASLGIDEWEVSRAAASKPFGYQPFWPGPGVGGPCIPVNPYYLLKTCNMPILQHATETSWRRPSEIVGRLMRLLENKRGMTGARRPLSDLKMRVLVVGVGFKRGQSMLHNSPGVAAIQCLLGTYDLDVEFADPLVDQTALAYVPKLNTSVDWNKNSLEEFAGILVTVDQVGLDMNLLDLLEGVIVHNYSPRSYTLASL